MTTTTQTPKRRTLGECSAQELLRSAQSELTALGERLDREHGHDLVTSAYVGSVGARLAVLEAKLREIADESPAVESALLGFRPETNR